MSDVGAGGILCSRTDASIDLYGTIGGCGIKLPT